jgi:hypothetical protein
MIPEFPHFKALELSDREEIETYVSNFPPFSDFNFGSLWAWDIDSCTRLTKLNGNLVVCFSDYVTGELFLSFLGTNMVNETIETLLVFSDERGLGERLKLVPESCLEKVNLEKYKLTEDLNNFDYIISIERMKPHDGLARPLSTRRKAIQKIKSQEKVVLTRINLNDEHIQHEIFEVALRWEIEQGVDLESIGRLKTALHRVIQLSSIKEFFAVGLYINGIFAGYSINELLENKYVLGCFQQANLLATKAAYALLMEEACQMFDTYGYTLLNLEQDMGLPGLRSWKRSCSPVGYLKKYIITRK